MRSSNDLGLDDAVESDSLSPAFRSDKEIDQKIQEGLEIGVQEWMVEEVSELSRSVWEKQKRDESLLLS